MRAVVFAVLAACYRPTAQVGLPCADNGACPSGQMCDPRTDHCVTPGTKDDAAIDSAIAVDARSDAPPDAPNLSGCSDGQREAFDLAGFPHVAGCAATWSGTPSMRAPTTGVACGDDLGPCSVPASACAAGWHVCAASGSVAELTQVSAEACHSAAATGRFLAASSHCTNNVDQCEYGPTLPCFDDGWCSEPVCCGAGCANGAGCPDGVWTGGTWVSATNDSGCGAQPGAPDLGVLCCIN